MSEGYNYRSNLEAPDLRPYFKHTWERVTPQSYGHLVLSDFYDKPADDPVFAEWRNICGFWTLDEAAILYNCALQMQGRWLDIGSHTGWTTANIVEAGNRVIAVDPMYSNAEFRDYASGNLMRYLYWICVELEARTANEFFAAPENTYTQFNGVCIDGNHSSPCPLEDAQNSAKHLNDRGVILLHDYRGEPIKEAYRWLLANGFQGRTYTTPNGVAVCWRGEFTPPEHVPDPKLPPV